MAIPKSQLDAWSGRGADVGSADAYARIKTAIEDRWPAGRPKPKVYLQGSYANDTHIRGESDVDVVVEFEKTFHHNIWSLPVDHVQRWQAAFPTTASYDWPEVRRDTLAALHAAFPGAVTEGKKALKVKLSDRMMVDVVPAVTYYEYQSFHSLPGTGHAGISFRDTAGSGIVNYPLLHIAYGQAKNAAERTRGQYKPIVRIFKNLRSDLVERGLLADGVAPSYFVEGLLHNVPDALFLGTYDLAALAILRHLWATPVDSYLAQNGRVLLVGEGNTQWPRQNAVAFIAAAVHRWDSYS